MRTLLLMLCLLGFALAAQAELAGSRGGSSGGPTGSADGMSTTAAVSKHFESCSNEEKQNLVRTGCISHFEKNPDALRFARPCGQSILGYTVTRALTILPKCSTGVGKAWADQATDLYKFMTEGLPNAVSKSMAQDQQMRENLRLCNADQSLVKKRELLTQHNLSEWQDDRIRRTSCEDIISAGSRRQRSTIQNNAIREAADASMRTPEQRQEAAANSQQRLEQAARDGRENWNKAYNSAQLWLKEKAGVPMSCYNSQKQDELICYGLASVITPDVVAGAGVIARIRSIAGVTRASEATGAAMANAAQRTEAQALRGMSSESRDAMLARSGSLNDAGRVNQAESLLSQSRPDGLSASQREAVLEAHRVGAAEGRGYGAYTTQDIAEKNRILKEAGFNETERELLMRSGTTGRSDGFIDAGIIAGDTRFATQKAEGSRRPFYDGEQALARGEQVEAAAYYREAARRAESSSQAAAARDAWIRSGDISSYSNQVRTQSVARQELNRIDAEIAKLEQLRDDRSITNRPAPEYYSRLIRNYESARKHLLESMEIFP